MNWYKNISKINGIIKKIIKNKIKFHKQEYNYSCGNAVIENLYILLGKKAPTEEYLKNIMQTTPESGTSPEAIEKFLNKDNINFRKFEKNDNIESILKNNEVIIIEYQDYQKDHDQKDIKNLTSSHFAILAGYDKDFYYIIDSFLPREYKTTSTLKKILKSKFLNNWKSRSFDGSKIDEKWGLIISI